MNKIELPEFETKSDRIKFLQANKSTLIAQKKAIIKHTDALILYPSTVGPDKAIHTIKENHPVEDPGNELKVKVVINTTNLLDSHMDVHLPGIWDKSVSENKSIMMLQEHKMSFDKIIADGGDLKAMTQTFGWGDLGQPQFKGVTEALVFEANIRKSRNEFMLDQYANGFVKQHSVGMRYVQLGLALNDSSSSNAAEFEAWEKYFNQIVNPEVADKKGFFWFVKEAKAIEGSAVPLGSNWVTPTLDNNLKTEPTFVTPKIQPSKDTEDKDFFYGW